MVEDRITDGTRIAQLLSSELDGREDGAFAAVAVTNADTDVEPTPDGARAYDVEIVGDARDDGGSEGDEDETEGRRIARAFVHEDRAHLEFELQQDRAAEEAEAADLRVRPKATQPPRTLVFVESGAAVKRATDVVCAVVRGLEADADT
ncbi:hypothetical protein SAMN05444422_11164 [Halobiforma haloterrestris]|uniref:DUF7993 domain-containing protein n=1 Tax=Natronobacterium haloterrestre TaxID=148448 RepID=A0A1I1KDV8_NATHA|nr:hypothetical protein [Halobiforma haloterrestris]SFC58986.1 hypothetical protein SAMN05444422_11164 [Halobiforma haloterrestris]